MSEEPHPEQSEVAPLCAWCGRRPLPEEGRRGRVCARCVQLLRDAGFRDEEIFGPPEPQAANK